MKKTLFLFRHSVAYKNSNMSNEEISLSSEGICKMKPLLNNMKIQNVSHVFSSCFKRAIETALCISTMVNLDQRFNERVIGYGNYEKEDWVRQHNDIMYKLPKGESFFEVGNRMNDALTSILHKDNDEYVFVVSHGAAIVSYLKRFCTVEVVNADKKIRKITFNNRSVMQGEVKSPSCFIIIFNDDIVSSVEYFDYCN